MIDPTPGTKLYTVWTGRDEWLLCEAWFVHRRGSWRRLRDIHTGEEWNENGVYRWHTTVNGALLNAIGYVGFGSTEEQQEKAKKALDLMLKWSGLALSERKKLGAIRD